MRHNLYGDKLLVVCPILDERVTDTCLNSIIDYPSAFGIDPENILLVDNGAIPFGEKYTTARFRLYRDPSGHNLGCARSWNIGVKEVLDKKLEYLVILSASMEFGPVLNTTFYVQLLTHWGTSIIEATGHGWHLIAIHRTVFEKVGLFDENFYPAYHEDVDFGRRILLTDKNYRWENVWINATSTGNAFHVRAGLVSCPSKPLLEYYDKKWGGPKGQERFTRPFNTQDIDYFPKFTIPELAAKYKLETWW